MKRVTPRLNPSSLLPWVQRELASLKAQGIYASHWKHEKGHGFGMVLVDVGSGELHVLADGTVTRHVELGTQNVVLSTSTVAHSEQEFIKLYEEFKARVCEWPARSDKSA
jgi:hypothetical protein